MTTHKKSDLAGSLQNQTKQIHSQYTRYAPSVQASQVKSPFLAGFCFAGGRIQGAQKAKGEDCATALWLAASVDHSSGVSGFLRSCRFLRLLRAICSTANCIGFSSCSAGGCLSGKAGACLSFIGHSSDSSAFALHCYAAASLELNSMCMRSYGRMIFSPSLSRTPPFSSDCTSLYTPRKSRLTLRDNSRMDIAGAPSIALIICQRLGASIVFASCSTVGNTSSEPMKSPLIARAAFAAAARKASSTDITLTVNTLMVSPSERVDISVKAGYQVLDRSESYGVFSFTNMLMVAFTPLVVVAHHANPFNDISQAVFVLMVTSHDCRFHLQNSDDCEGIICNLDPCVHQLKSWHLPLPYSDVNNNIINGVMKAVTSKKDDSHPLCAKTACTGLTGCVNVILHPSKTGAGRRNPDMSKATPDALSVFFYVATLAHLTAYSRIESMVALVGQPKGWPVSLLAGIPTPISVTTPQECRNSGGDSLNMSKEIAIMATIPAHPLFIWRFFSCQTCKYHTVTACTEREARALLSEPSCLFAARIRIPAQGVRHA